LAATDAARAYSAIWELAGSPSSAVPFLREHLLSLRRVDAQLVDRLVADLDHQSFRRREQAADRLVELGVAVEPALVRLMASNPPLEQRRRAESVLRRLSQSASHLQAVRATQALEHAGTDKAWKVLDELSLAPGSSVSQQARDALARRAKE